MSRFYAAVVGVLRSRRFFIAILVLFALESLWIALSSAYSGVFDENTHFGIIQIHAHQWSPIILDQPPDSGFAGALTRDPSYLYHYLLSFPYRVLSALTDSQTVQVIGLRLVNIALFGWGLILFRRVLLRTRASVPTVHLTMLGFILIPVVPLLASEINYDNLIMPLAALAFLWTIDIAEGFKRRQLSLVKLGSLLALCLLSSLVQFEFLPIMTTLALSLIWLFWRLSRADKKALWRNARTQWQKVSDVRRVALAATLAIAIGLFVQMYGVNVVRYHSLTPQCHQVLSVEQCHQFGSWERNYQAVQHKQTINPNPVLFAGSWGYRMSLTLFYTSSGGASPNAWYLSVNPLPVLFIGSLLLLGLGAVLTLVYWRQLTKRYAHLGMFLFVAIFYATMLYLRTYHDYLVIGQKIAMNGRYLFPVLLPCILIIGLAYQRWLVKPGYRLALLGLLFLLFLQGGGALTYITYSNRDWYWPSSFSVRINEAAQHIVKPLVIIEKPLPPVGGL